MEEIIEDLEKESQPNLELLYIHNSFCHSGRSGTNYRLNCLLNSLHDYLSFNGPHSRIFVGVYCER